MLKNTAYTLIEVMIVVLILGILANLSAPMIQVSVYKTQPTEAIGVIARINKGEELYYSEHGRYLNLNMGSSDEEWSALGMENMTADPESKYKYDVYTGVFWNKCQDYEAIFAYLKEEVPKGYTVKYWRNDTTGTYAPGEVEYIWINRS
jgi:prepilin-type N-terminal cleavage/methylation domain-containing protein